MADPQQVKFLLDTSGQETGQKTWLEYKLKVKYIDLSMAALAGCALGDYDLSEVNLSTAVLRQANLSGANLSKANMNYADMRRVNLHKAVMDRANLDSTNLQEANLTDASLEQARLCKAKLGRANLTGADLSGCNLAEADLHGACLKYTRLTGANLDGANFERADLTGAILDDDAPRRMLNFSEAFIDDRKYRELHSSLRPDATQDQAEGERLKPSLPNRKPPKPETGNGHGATHALGDEETEPGSINGFKLPKREREPDLTTVEGCCRVLEVPVNASLEEIIKAFRAKAKIFHPDKTRHLNERLQELAAGEFRHLRQAYEALTCRTARPLTGVNWPEGLPRRASPYDYSSEEYERLARLNPANTNVLYNLAWKYFDEGHHAQALAGFQRVLTLNPNDEDAQYNLMMIRIYSEIVLPVLGPKGLDKMNAE